MTWTAYAWVAFGGALGAMARAFVGTWVQGKVHSTFPWGTFLINATGSLLLGFIATLLAERVISHPNIRPFITIGFIGAYTTFSTFEYESFQLGPSLVALANILGSVIVGYGCVWIGARLALLVSSMHVFARS
jgi:CrcB protein